MPLDQLFAQTRGHLLCQHGFTRAGLTLNQQGPLERYRGVNRHPQIVCRDVPLCTFKLHISPLLSECMRPSRLTEVRLTNHSQAGAARPPPRPEKAGDCT